MTVSARARYQWTTGGGAWASLHQKSSGLPGRAMVDQRLAAEDGGLSLRYQGFPEGLKYIVPYPGEQGGLVAEPARRTGWRAIRDGVAEPGADLLLVGCSARRARRLPAPRSLVLPFRVNLLLDVTADIDTMYRRVSRRQRREFAASRRKHEWTAEISHDEGDLDFFYERMHLPAMSVRHGGKTRSTDRDIALHCLLHKGFLLFVTEGGKRVTGVLCRLDDHGRTLRMRLLGVLDGDETHYRSGAVKAVYYLTMEWAAAHGVTRIDFAGADPFPGRGVYQFKSRFHPVTALPADHHRDRRVYVRINADTPRVRDFLVATPMIAVDDSGRLVATYFRDAVRHERTDIVAEGPGVHATRVIDLDEFLVGAQRTPTRR
ncbi:GNAT family N-acetyltransferase [Amycolatopsis sp. NPDC088138]|uniref:GNAT family N-acetyltransferase n=1 Tax=Amycolatopsis sp. NPDC088138 TaxID=3363938 RepID=UPI0038276229